MKNLKLSITFFFVLISQYCFAGGFKGDLIEEYVVFTFILLNLIFWHVSWFAHLIKSLSFKTILKTIMVIIELPVIFIEILGVALFPPIVVLLILHIVLFIYKIKLFNAESIKLETLRLLSGIISLIIFIVGFLVLVFQNDIDEKYQFILLLLLALFGVLFPVFFARKQINQH